MAENKLSSPIKLCKQWLYNYNVSSVVFVFSMLNIRSCCRQSAHVSTLRYDSTLLGAPFYTKCVFA